MANKKVIIGAAVAAAVLAGVAVAMSRSKKAKKYRAHVEEAKQTFKGKLNELQRKAEKEFKNAAGDAVNAAKDRATEWAGKSSAKM